VSGLAVLLTYLAGMRLLYQRPAVEETLGIPNDPSDRRPLVGALLGFAAASLVILIAARFLASSARDIAQMLGLGTGFVGMLLVGLTTSLPELVVSLASVRMGAYDLAVGNLFGSNAFNMAIIVVLDLANGKEPILSGVSPDLMMGAMLGIFMVGVALIGVLYRAETRFWKLEPDTILILLYVLGMGLLYREIRSYTPVAIRRPADLLQDSAFSAAPATAYRGLQQPFTGVKTGEYHHLSTTLPF
jgi:cation:H+ antiporter